MNSPRTVILDTDIGGDIDDTWALAMLLNSPELAPKLVVSASADTVYRAKIVAKLLERNGRSDIAVGIGVREPSDGPREHQQKWITDYQLKQYPGTVHEDGVQAMIELVNASSDEVTLIAIGPLTNIAAMIRRAPGVTRKIHFIAMMGSIARNHRDQPGAIAEFNVVQDIAAAQTVYAAPWASMTITPLDSCGNIVLDGERYQRLLGSSSPLVRDVIENYMVWSSDCGWAPENPRKCSSILYDTVAVYLACSTARLRMEDMNLIVDDQGFTKGNAAGPLVHVAMAWKDFDGYLDELVERLLR